MPSSPAIWPSMAGTSCVPGAPPAIRSPSCRAVMVTSWPSAAKITPSGPNASLPMCLNSGVTPVVASELDAASAPAAARLAATTKSRPMRAVDML